MFIQKVLKGIAGLTWAEARDMATAAGILSNWWRQKGPITPVEVQEILTMTNLFNHLNKYDDPLPASHPLLLLGKTYGDVSPFISTTAGAVQRSDFYRQNIIFSPFMTALRFATKNFTQKGYIFYGYVFTMGKQTVAHWHMAEEVRELHIYTGYLPFHREGEITAKVHIPAVCIEKVEEYDGPAALADLTAGRTPAYMHQEINSKYEVPEQFSNIREVL